MSVWIVYNVNVLENIVYMICLQLHYNSQHSV